VAIDQSLPEALHIHAVKLIYRTRIVGHRQVTIHFDHNVSHLRLFTVTQDYTGEYSICKVLLVGLNMWITDIFRVEHWCDLELWLCGHSRSL